MAINIILVPVTNFVIFINTIMIIINAVILIKDNEC